MDDVTREPSYIYEWDGVKETYAYGDVIHIRAPSLNGIDGLSPVMAAKEAIALALAMERHTGTLFKNGARPGGIISIPGEIGDEPAQRLAESWHDANSGEGQGGTAVLEGGATYQTIAMTAVDAQLIDMKRWAVEEIGRVYRVPPIFLNDYGRATWSNNEAQGGQLVTYCLMRWMKVWQGEIRLKLIKPDDRKEFFAEFLADDLLRADTAKRMAAYGIAIQNRIRSPNEVRAMENLPPYEGGDEFINPHTTPMKAPAERPEGSSDGDTLE